MLGGRALVLIYLPEPLLHCSPVLTLDTTTWPSCCSPNKPSFLCPLCFPFLEYFPHSICLLLFPSKAQIACTSLLQVKFWSILRSKGRSSTHSDHTLLLSKSTSVIMSLYCSYFCSRLKPQLTRRLESNSYLKVWILFYSTFHPPC